MSFISIIIPIYNTAPYLRQCIDSVLSQTFKDFELILINDGSNDSSGEIIDFYQKNDTRISAIHKVNTGVSDSRNIGINSAKGKIICFVDSDDWIDTDYLETFVNNFENSNTLLIQNIKRNGSSINRYNYKKYNIKAETCSLFKDNNLLYSGGPVTKFYDQAILLENEIYFKKNVSYGEDLMFFLDYIKNIDCIQFLDYSKYNYRHIEGSLSTKRSHSLENYTSVYLSISQFIAWAKITEPSTMKYFNTIEWDMIETGIDQNIHFPINKIRKQLLLLTSSLSKNHFHFANINRKITYILIKTKSFFILKQYKKTLNKLVKLIKSL